jgi:aminopeptidase
MIHADAKQYDLIAKNNLALMKKTDCYIAVRGSHNITEAPTCRPDKMKLVMAKLRPVQNERVNNSRWVVLRWPTPSMAQQAGMSTQAFEDFFFRVCLLDYAALLPAMNALKKLMDKTQQVHITGPGTDLRFSLKGLKAIACGGNHNIPDGEVFSAPVKDSVEGVISYNAPTIYQGIAFDSVKLEFSKGKIVKATANNTEAINKIFDSDPAPATSANSPSASIARSKSPCATSSSTKRSPAASTSPPARPTKASPTTATAARSTGISSTSSAPTTAAAKFASTASSSAKTASSSCLS